MSAVLLKWTLTDAPGAADIDGLILGFAGMLLAQGIPVSRCSSSGPEIHVQSACNLWRRRRPFLKCSLQGSRAGLLSTSARSLYGNIGAEDRLDFTVIGAAVNLASRLEGLCGKLGVPWLVSNAVAGKVDGELTDLGVHALKGVKGPMRVWGPPFTPGAKTHEL